MRSDSMFADMCHFPVWPLFDDNLIAAWNLQIDRCQRRSNIKWNIVIFGNDRNLIGANFIGRITIGHHTICTNNNRRNILKIDGEI